MHNLDELCVVIHCFLANCGFIFVVFCIGSGNMFKYFVINNIL
ncbi:unnamed protein product [Paramecium octaurelia]|uniref:Uncharacterized protein n=1 Tax=Paramecium octaurelia TaxID=43137 RepID=A0A8S1XP23_PAROT|nr:unnamed protein product [Paramecium octaurelia]